jgi:hypothetical protein
MKELSDNKVSKKGNHFIREIAALDKNLELKPNKLERLKCLRSELSGGKLYVKYCKGRIEMEESIHEYEKEFPSGSEYPLPPEPKFNENNPGKDQTSVNNNILPKTEKSEPVNVFCKSMPLSIPKNHFKVFTENNSKNGKPFLSPEQLDAFIDRAFCGNTKFQKIKFNLDSREISAIRYVFYQFYNTYYFEYFETLQCRPAFIRLLTDNFEGWDFETVNENFNKKPKKTI